MDLHLTTLLTTVRCQHNAYFTCNRAYIIWCIWWREEALAALIRAHTETATCLPLGCGTYHFSWGTVPLYICKFGINGVGYGGMHPTSAGNRSCPTMCCAVYRITRYCPERGPSRIKLIKYDIINGIHYGFTTVERGHGCALDYFNSLESRVGSCISVSINAVCRHIGTRFARIVSEGHVTTTTHEASLGSTSGGTCASSVYMPTHTSINHRIGELMQANVVSFFAYMCSHVIDSAGFLGQEFISECKK